MIKKILNLVFSIAIVVFFASCDCGSNDHDDHDGHDHDGHDHEHSESMEHGSHEGAVKPASSTGNFGAIISPENSYAAAELPTILEGKETIEVKLAGNIESVCQMSGCWIDVSIGNGETVHVTFKDDGFVLPKDAAGKYTVIEGEATYEEIPVKLLKHLAKDEGKTQEEIDAITEPKMEYTLVANGVIISESEL